MVTHRRFLVDPADIRDGAAVLSGQTARQIAKVLRLKEGDRIVVVDGRGGEHDAVIRALSKDQVTATIMCTNTCAGEPALKLALAICALKGDKLELVVGKGTELGISEFVILDSERGVARPRGARAEARIERLRRIAAEAAEQSGRARAPEVRGVVPFSDVAGLVGACEAALVAWEEEKSTPIRQALRARGPAASALLIVGPEGGLSEREARLAVEAGAASVSLGRRILRAETAAIAAAAAIMYELEGEL